MGNYNSLREAFVARKAEHNVIEKSPVTLPLLIMLAGLGLMFVVIYAGILLFIAGTVMLLKAPKYRYTPTQKAVVYKRKFCSVTDKEYIQDCLQNGALKRSYEFHTDQSNALLLETYKEKSNNFLAVQLLQFVPYEYQPVTEPLFFHGEEAQRLIKALTL